MDRVLKPQRFETDPDDSSAGKQWNHWFQTFKNFLASIASATTTDAMKLSVLTNYVAPNVFEYISDCSTYAAAVTTLEEIYEKPKSEIFSRHLLQTRKQNPGESLDQFLHALKILAKDCKFSAVSAADYKAESIRDSFINGLSSGYIRQRLFELKDLNLQTAFENARSLEMAHKHAGSYMDSHHVVAHASKTYDSELESIHTFSKKEEEFESSVTASVKQKCYFCGFDRHPRNKCPAKDATCNLCSKTGHWARCCRSSDRKTETKAAAIFLASASKSLKIEDSLKKSKITLKVGGIFSESFIYLYL